MTCLLPSPVAAQGPGLPRLTLDNLQYIIHHVFLPPKLPDGDDFTSANETALLEIVGDGIRAFVDRASSMSHAPASTALITIDNLRALMDDSCLVRAECLSSLLRCLPSRGGFIPIPLKAQNAGIIIRRSRDCIVFETFELSPSNGPVISTCGRLRRRFPAAAVAVPLKIFEEDGFQAVIVDTVVKMSHQTTSETKPKARKAKQLHNEDRDTIDPRLATELLTSFLRGVGKQVDLPSLVKNTREEIMWSNQKLPWRRSATWLLIRVSLQLTFDRAAAANIHKVDSLYKPFMLFLMSRIVDLARSKTLPSDTLCAMSSKLSRRLLKLRRSESGVWADAAQHAIAETAKDLHARWRQIIRAAEPSLDLSRLSKLDMDQDLSLRLPGLDRFIASIAERSIVSSPSDFHPPTELLFLPAYHLPHGVAAGSVPYEAFRLADLEAWVASSLDDWLEGHIGDQDTCGHIAKLIKAYHAVSRAHYAKNPEGSSIMLLTILELWVACDKSAVAGCSLLGDYDPELPLPVFQSLLLSFQSDMARLARAERYLRGRQQIAHARRCPSIFRSFGEASSFSVRYYSGSRSQQLLLSRIEEQATQDRRAKLRELSRLQAQYDQLMRLHSQSTCDYFKIVQDGLVDSRHSPSCKHCGYVRQANSLTIAVHEWPLPNDPREAQSVVFELDVPVAFQAWRDSTVFVINDVLKCEPLDTRRPKARHPLNSYSGLCRYLTRSSPGRVHLLSEAKPHAVTHRRDKCIADTSEHDVCVNNGLHYQYFDDALSAFVSEFQSTRGLSALCTLRLPERSISMQKFLERPHDQPMGMPPNAVIAGQSACPEHLSLDEFKASASLPLGFRIQWMNILRELAIPYVDLNKQETVIFILQTACQAGPELDGIVHRATHEILTDEEFALAILIRLQMSVERAKENSESCLALWALTALSTRILSLAPKRVHHGFLGLLTQCRVASFRWIDKLRGKDSQAMDDDRRMELSKRISEACYICTESFNVDQEHLESILSDSVEASILLECSMVLQETSLSAWTGDVLQTTMRHRWQRLLYRALPFLTVQVTQKDNNCLDIAIGHAWSAYIPGGKWNIESSARYWFVTRMRNISGDVSVQVHFNALTAELLVNGAPLSRLPSSYEQHSTYRKLFRRLTLDVMPSAAPGMKFSTKKSFAGQSLHFGMHREAGSPLLLQANRQGRHLDLVPSSVLQHRLPESLVHDFVHWYHHERNEIEFRPIEDCWLELPTNWRMTRRGSAWQLRRGDQTSLISPDSNTATQINGVLSPLETPLRIHLWYNETSCSLDIELPRLRLSFDLQHSCSSLRSRQFRGMVVDGRQAIGTLIGCKSKLLLRDAENPDKRMVMIPEGRVACVRTVEHSDPQSHVSVSVDRDTVSRVQSFWVDSHLGQLIGNGTLQSKLYLACLHALTSYCIPDPLTGHTGTEQALAILESSAVRSFDCLSRDNIDTLVGIARLAPGRAYYPHHEKVMQTVTWSPTLSFLSQHGQFYNIVRTLFSQARETGFLYPDAYIDPDDVDHADEHLVQRDLIRSSTLRVSGFGAEAHTTDYDADYRARDQGQNSDQAKRACRAVSKVATGHQYLEHWPQHGFVMDLYRLLTALGMTLGPDPMLKPRDLQYDSKWLKDPKTFLPNIWCRIHHAFNQDRTWANRFCLMMWIATLSYGKNSDPHAIQTLVAIMVSPEVSQVPVPSIPSFDLSEGSDMKISELRAAVEVASIPFGQCPEVDLQPYRWETAKDTRNRRKLEHVRNKNAATELFLNEIQSQWPCLNPTEPTATFIQTYIHTSDATKEIRPLFKTWFHNLQFKRYLEHIESALCGIAVQPFPVSAFEIASSKPANSRPRGFVSIASMFERPAPSDLPYAPVLPDLVEAVPLDEKPHMKLAEVLENLDSHACSEYEKRYLVELRDSLQSLRDRPERYTPRLRMIAKEHVLLTYLRHCREHVDAIYARLIEAVGGCLELSRPRCAPILFLQQLGKARWRHLHDGWKLAIVTYGIAITALIKAERLCQLLGNDADLVQELTNIGHQNWKPHEHPEYLLLEIESGILIREVQKQIAEQMISPPGNQNAFMQLNMGEGKSSVIVPIVAASLADGDQLVRVIVTKAQSKQMFQLLVSKLGGLLARRIYHMPFSRAIRVGGAEVETISKICMQCMRDGGILLVQPEHLLSFQLMGLECLITGREEVGRSLLNTQDFFDTRSRDVVDESDENFSVKFELIYTMGQQQPIEHSPDRWGIIQEVLCLVGKFASEVQRALPQSIQVDDRHQGRLSKTRLFRPDAERMLINLIAAHICKTGFGGFPVARQSVETRAAVLRYITEPGLTPVAIAAVEDGPFWSDTTTNPLLLLRGLLAGGILAFALGHKRWRVNYGIDANRQPSTRLVVPFRAKDSPSPRSEFSHPDVVIVLTCLSYYYGGMSQQDLFDAFENLFRSDQADAEYQRWVATAPSLPQAFRHLVGINIRDKMQCIDEIFPHLQFSKGAIDYFLSRLVFSKEMKEFPHKLSASSWDLGKVKTKPTTGFSGTNDSRYVLPLAVSQLDLPNQRHTNALVLEHLLQPENGVAIMPRRAGGDISDGELLLDMVTRMNPETRVILDVGANVIELSNLQVAQRWLELVENDQETQAVVFFDDRDELAVVDRVGRIESLQTSPFAKYLNVCLVFLDEAHTRGTDLKLPEKYRAAVTLGANLTKDRLVQACMRMRKLGKGQSVVFCVPEEIQTKISLRKNSKSSAITVSDVLKWAISETCIDLRRTVPLWATQGTRFERHKEHWQKQAGLRDMTKAVARQFLEDEAQSLNSRYRPRALADTPSVTSEPPKSEPLGLIADRCRQFDSLDLSTATLQEEQERELSPEIEEERQVERPAAAEPATHSIHVQLRIFIKTGLLHPDLGGFKPAFSTLGDTTAADLFDLDQFPRGLWATEDFSRTVKLVKDMRNRSDYYQRPVQWILTSTAGGDTVKYMVIISPYEADELLSQIKVHNKVTLHVYSPRPNLGFQPLDHLTLYTIPGPRRQLNIPRELVVQLNIFSGQLYFSSFAEYIEVCNCLGLAWNAAEDGIAVGADGFIVLGDGSTNVSGFKQSPVKFVKALLTKVRRNCEGIDKTHLGRVLDGALLTENDF